MNLPRLLLVAAAVGLAINIYDFLLHGVLLQGPLYSGLTDFMRPDVSPVLLVLTDFVAALVFVWFYDRVRTAFPPGPRGGAVFGLYAAVLVGFPTWISCCLLIGGFTYALAWTWTLAGLGWGLIAGSIAGALSGSPA
jgi:hypothetical protein